MTPRLSAPSDPAFYFGDRDYTDYRELVCFERPVCFILHYYYGFTVTRLWLFDRMAFTFANGELQIRENALTHFLRRKNVVQEIELQPGEAFVRFLHREINPRSALIAPIETQIGSSRIVTSFLIERLNANTGLDCTCLRGDDFFISRSYDPLEIERRLARENGKVAFHRVNIPFWMENNTRSAADLWNEYGLRQRFLDLLTAHGFIGSGQLSLFLRSRDHGCEYFAVKVREGLLNVLLVEVFWPMLFAYSPFVVFMRYALREKLDLGLKLGSHKVESVLTAIGEQAERITNIAYIFGRQPEERNYLRFLAAMRGMIEYYGQLEFLIQDAL